MRYSELDALVELAQRVTNRVPQCAYETIESRLGACDGGERCRNKATWYDNNEIPYCDKHGMN